MRLLPVFLMRQFLLLLQLTLNVRIIILESYHVELLPNNLDSLFFDTYGTSQNISSTTPILSLQNIVSTVTNKSQYSAVHATSQHYIHRFTLS
jgi:hypothetical protein